MDINALHWGKNVTSILEGSSNIKIHSRYNNSVNLSVNNRLINITISDNIGPFSISIDKNSNMFESLRDNMHISYTLGVLHFPSFNISLSSDAMYDCYLEKLVYNKYILISNLKTLKNIININPSWRIGLDEDSTRENLIVLLDSLKFNKLTNDKIDFFLGRGQGLTPTGDDIILGLLATLIALGYRSLLVESFIPYILNEGLKRTTDISAEYLYYGCNFQFGSAVKQFLYSLFKGSKEEVLRSTIGLAKLGHTSGFDTIYGVYNTLDIFMEEFNGK